MVIFNGREMSSKFVRDNKIVEISSPIKDVAEALEAMKGCIKKGIPIVREDNPEHELASGDERSPFYVVSYRYSDDDFAIINKDTPEWKGKRNVFDEVLTETELEVLSDNLAVYERPEEFREYEKFNFLQETKLKFAQEKNVSDEEVYNELATGFGILPTLLVPFSLSGEEMNDDQKELSEMSIGELKALSKSGEGLVRMFKGEQYAVSKFNAPPPLSWIRAYQNLTPYEKRTVSDGRIHPAKAMQIARGVKTFAKEMLLRQEMIDSVIAGSSEKNRVQAKTVIEQYTVGFGRAYPEFLTMAEDVFKAKFRGHAPRVLSEYMEGALAARGTFPAACSREMAEDIASRFSQQNVSRVAKYRSPLLFALCEKVIMGNMKDNVLQAIAVSVPTASAQLMIEKGFPEWLNAHPDVKPDEVLKICKLLPQMGALDVNEKAKDVIAKIELADGYRDAKRFEEKAVYADQGYKFENNEIAIRGRNITVKQGNLTMRMLKADDYKNFLVGQATHCCQRFGDAGESCVYKYTSDPFAACVVIERGDKIVAQGFVWTDEVNDAFVFDNVELDNDRDVQQFSDLFAAYAKALPYANVHVGTGYNQGMNGWGQKVGQDKKNLICAKMPTTVDGRDSISGWGTGNCYSDYHTSGGSVARSIKHMGKMFLTQRADVRVEIKPDEPTRWDELAKPDLNFMLNDWQRTPEERIALAKQFRENPSEALQMEIVQSTPEAIASLDNPCYGAQMYILDRFPSLIWKIKHPCDEIKLRMVQEDPSYLHLIDNPPEEMLIEAVKKDGSVLSIIENPSENVCIEAVKQNGFAVKSIPSDKQTPAVQVAAVEREPKVISIIPYPCSEAVRTAVSVRPEMVCLVRDENLTADIQRIAVMEKPSVINMIGNPDPSAISLAVHQNGLMIRNFQQDYPELREVALRQNGFAARCLKNLTLDEARIAVEQNPNAISAIQDEEIVRQIRENTRTVPPIRQTPHGTNELEID